MSLDFGFNCRHYLPRLSKCRIAIDTYLSREDLLEDRWVDVGQALDYLNASGQELIRKVKEGEIESKIIKDGLVALRVKMRGPWSWDDCPLAGTGGQCIDFKAHGGPMIKYVMEIDRLKLRHPNEDLAPSESVVKEVERALTGVAPPLR
jgi:hypothetical protein